MVSHYILPILISFIIILIYELIRFRKQGFGNVLYTAVAPVALAQVLLFCIYAVCRIPVGSEDTIVSLILYIASICIGIRNLVRKAEEKKTEKKDGDDPIRVR